MVFIPEIRRWEVVWANTELDSYTPINPASCIFTVTLSIGEKDVPGDNLVDITCCTPDRVIDCFDNDAFLMTGRGIIIMKHYDREKLMKAIVRLVNDCAGHTRDIFWRKLTWYGKIEFDDEIIEGNV